LFCFPKLESRTPRAAARVHKMEATKFRTYLLKDNEVCRETQNARAAPSAG
jgi:hypothetical protein